MYNGHVTTIIGSEQSPERVPVSFVYGRSVNPKRKALGNALRIFSAKVAFLRPVGFVNHYIMLPVYSYRICIFKFMNHCYYYFSGVMLQQFM